MVSPPQKTGYAAIVGRPNVGKSTLLNHLMGFKLSITSRKPQTTRQQVLGVLTKDESQLIFVDTPGIHGGTSATGRVMNRYMNQQATSTLDDVDIVLFVIDSRGWVAADDEVLTHLKNTNTSVVCVLNKVDLLNDKERLLLLMKHVDEQLQPIAIVPTSALKSEGLDSLVKEIVAHLPEGPHLFGDDDVTDKPESFFISEMVREQLVRQLGDELPHRTAVTIEKSLFRETDVSVHAIIWVERKSQKGIVIGKNGQRLKQIGQSARTTISKFLNRKVNLFLVVRVRRGWTNDLKSLTSLGYR